MQSGGTFLEAFAAVPCLENAFLSRSEKTLVLRSTHGGLEIERVAWQMRRLLGLWVAMVGKIFRWRRTLKGKSGPPRGRMIWVTGNLPERPEEAAEGKQGNEGGDQEGKRREIEQHHRACGQAESALLLRDRVPPSAALPPSGSRVYGDGPLSAPGARILPVSLYIHVVWRIRRPPAGLGDAVGQRGCAGCGLLFDLRGPVYELLDLRGR